MYLWSNHVSHYLYPTLVETFTNILFGEENGSDNEEVGLWPSSGNQMNEFQSVSTQDCVIAASCLPLILSWPSRNNSMD